MQDNIAQSRVEVKLEWKSFKVSGCVFPKFKLCKWLGVHDGIEHLSFIHSCVVAFVISGAQAKIGPHFQKALRNKAHKPNYTFHARRVKQ